MALPLSPATVNNDTLTSSDNEHLVTSYDDTELLSVGQNDEIMDSSHSEIEDDENDTCLSSDSDDERAIDKPPERQCSYCGMFERWNVDIYECVKPNCGRKMCHKCKRKLHKRHIGNHLLLQNVQFANLRLNNMSYNSNI